MSDPAAKMSAEAHLARLLKEVRDLRTQLDATTQREDAQQKAFDTLYEELKQYKEDFAFQLEKPLLLDLLLFYDSLAWFQQALVKKELDVGAVAESFQYMIDEYLELLYRRDVIPMETPDRFDRKNQKAIKVVTTDDPKRDYAIEQVLKQGFVRNGKVLRAEEVIIARHGSGGPAEEER